MDVVFDNTGGMWRSQAALAGWLGTSLADQALIEYAVRNLGFVAAGYRSTGILVGLRPSKVSPVALFEAMAWCGRRQQSRFLVRSFDKSERWSHHVCGSVSVLFDMLIRATRPYESGDRDFRHRPLDPSLAVADCAFAELWEAWRVSGVDTRLDALRPVLHHALRDRYVVVEPRQNDDMSIVDCGSGLPLLNGELARQGVGTRLQDGADVRYASWAAGAYIAAQRARQPRLDAVDALIKIPQQPHRRSTYRRLILPISFPGGSPGLLSASVLDPSLDLRIHLA